MAQSLDEQVMTVERALGERMIESALLVVRAWMNELGEENKYEETHASIRERYNALFSIWLTSDDEANDELLDELTGETYQLVDAVYADIRLHRGLSPDMHGFNPELPQSVMNYFANCAKMRDEDLEWFRDIVQEGRRTETALIAIDALSHNLREMFSIDNFLSLIDAMSASKEIISDQAIVNVLLLLVHYDVRIDFFPQIQDAFMAAVTDMGDDGERVFQVLCAAVELLTTPDKIEQEYLKGLFPLVPQTWVYEVLVEGSPTREKALTHSYVTSGFLEMMWVHPEVAEQVFVNRLRKGKGEARDYIRYAHCLMLKGDRLMAFENYKQARQMFSSVKDFYALFRPDRGTLVEHGIPLEQVYLIEDQLFRIDD